MAEGGATVLSPEAEGLAQDPLDSSQLQLLSLNLQTDPGLREQTQTHGELTHSRTFWLELRPQTAESKSSRMS